MKLNEHDLRQLDEERLRQLHERDPSALVNLSINLLSDLKEVRERLGQTPENSSRPPSSRAPWDSPKVTDDTPAPDVVAESDDVPERDESTEPVDSTEPVEPEPSHNETPCGASLPTQGKKSPKGPSRKPGKQKGAPGFSRQQRLALTGRQAHMPAACPVCGNHTLDHAAAVAHTAFDVMDLEREDTPNPSLRLSHIRHTFYQCRCSCGHAVRQEPYQAAPDGKTWDGVGLSEWRLVGPGLAARIVWMHLRMRLSRRYIQEFLYEMFGLELSVGTIQNTLMESARALEPIEAQLLEALVESDLLHADETSHKQGKEALWLWTLVSTTTIIFAVGRRTSELFWGLLGERFTGWLMSDGYSVYRRYSKRLRCWAHLIRKARFLADTLTPHVQGYGRKCLATFETLIAAIKVAREQPTGNLMQVYENELDALSELSETMARSRHTKARELGNEILNDWDAIMRVLEHPHLPITNNEAERALRHWVILRRITYGTRTQQGSRAFSILASVIATCRLRKVSPLEYMQQAIGMARQGALLPSLPQAAVSFGSGV